MSSAEGIVTVLTLIPSKWPVALVDTESTTVNVPPYPGDAPEVVSVLDVASWVIVTSPDVFEVVIYVLPNTPTVSPEFIVVGVVPSETLKVYVPGIVAISAQVLFLVRYLSPDVATPSIALMSAVIVTAPPVAVSGVKSIYVPSAVVTVV